MDVDSVAAIVPCYAYPQWLPEALDSLTKQTVPFGTIVCVFDCPNLFRRESYQEIMYQIERLTGRVHQIWLKRNRGVSAARNAALHLVQDLGYEWYVNLDEDDLLNPRYVERGLQAVKLAPWVDVWYTDYCFFGDMTTYVRTPPFQAKTLRTANFITSTALIRTRVWDHLYRMNGQGYDEDLHQAGLRFEDWLFYLEAAHLGHWMARIGMGGLLRARMHGFSGSSIANSTVPQWKEYTARKFKQIYSEEVWPEDTKSS